MIQVLVILESNTANLFYINLLRMKDEIEASCRCYLYLFDWDRLFLFLLRDNFLINPFNRIRNHLFINLSMALV